MVTENDSFVRQLPQRWRIFLAEEIRAHPIPNNNHDMSLGFGRFYRKYALPIECTDNPC